MKNKLSITAVNFEKLKKDIHDFKVFLFYDIPASDYVTLIRDIFKLSHYAIDETDLDYVSSADYLKVKNAIDSFKPQEGDIVLDEDEEAMTYLYTTKDGMHITTFQEDYPLSNRSSILTSGQIYPITESPLEEEDVIVELTLQDITEGKGFGVPAHLIRIKK